MTKELSVGCIATDRTRPVLDGHIAIEGYKVKPVIGEPEDLFGPALQDGAFDVAEMSLSSHILTTARGDSKYIGVPIFTSRAFRHSSIFVRTDRGIVTLKDLAGRRIGLPEYQQTAGLWMRGIMEDEAGVTPRDVVWVTGGLNGPGHGERIPIRLPPDIKLEIMAAGDTLSGALARGHLDAIIAPKTPACFNDGKSAVDRLFPKYWEEEERYAHRSGFFPIMHCLAVRRDVAEADPRLPAAVYAAFKAAKDVALNELTMTNVARVSLPWLSQDVARVRAVLGARFWSYGFKDNERELQAMARYAHRSGLTDRELPADMLFSPSTVGLED